MENDKDIENKMDLTNRRTEFLRKSAWNGWRNGTCLRTKPSRAQQAEIDRECDSLMRLYRKLKEGRTISSKDLSKQQPKRKRAVVIRNLAAEQHGDEEITANEQDRVLQLVNDVMFSDITYQKLLEESNKDSVVHLVGQALLDRKLLSP